MVAYQGELALELLPGHDEFQVSLFQAFQEEPFIFPAVFGCRMLIETPVPDDDVAGAVIALGDDPFKIFIVERMIFHLHGQPFLGRVHGRSL